MSSRRLALALVACCWVPLTVHAKEIVGVIPGDTLGYVVINRLAETDGKIQAMGERMKLPIPSLVSMVKTQSGIAEGIDESGSIALAVLPSSDGPTAVLYVPVDDYAGFIEQLEPEGTEDGITTGRLVGRPVIVGKKNSHAVVTQPKYRMVLQKVLSDEAKGQGTIDLARALKGDHDVLAVLPSEGVQMLTSLGQRGLNEAKTALREQFDEDNPVLAGIEVYVQILNAISSEVEAAVVGLEFRQEGSIRINECVWIQPSGKMAPILRDIKPSSGDLLAGLPKVPFVAAFGVAVPSGSFEPMINFSKRIMKSMPQLYGLTPEQVDDVMDLSLKYLPDMDGMSFMLGVGREGTPLYSEMLGAMHVPDAEAYVANYRKYWEELEEVVADAEDSIFKGAKVEDVTMDGVPVIKVVMPMPGFEGLGLPDNIQLDDLMEKFYGPGGLTMYLAATDDNTVMIGYTDMELLRKGLQAAKDETKQMSRDQNLLNTSKQLPAGAHVIGYWSPSGTMAFATRMVCLMTGSETEIPLPAFPDAPPVGFAMTAAPSLLTFRTVVPAETIEAIGSFVQQIRQPGGAEPAGE